MAGIQAGGGSAGRLSIEIVAEVARLQSDMDKVRRLVKDASGDIAKNAKAANDNLGGIGSGLAKARARNSTALTQLSFQLNDVATMAMSGSGAMQIFGTQAGQILQVVQQADGGLKGLAAAILGVIAPFTPLLALLALLAGAVALMTADINENGKVHVTWMDTLLGAYDAVKAYLTGQLAAAFDYFGVKSGDVWQTVYDWTKWAMNKIIGVTSLVPRMLLDNWKLIPAGVADIFYSAVNSAIDAINSLISRSVNGVNGFINTANGILSKAGLSLPTLSAPQIARVQNSYNGAAVKLAKGVTKTFKETLSRDFIGEGAAYLSPFAQARARKRLAEDAKKAGKDAGSKLGKGLADGAAKPVEDLLAKLQTDQMSDFMKDFLAGLEKDWKDFNDRVGNTVAANIEFARIETDKAKQSADEYAQSLADVVGEMSAMGKVGGLLGGLLGVLTGNTRSVQGPLGSFFNIGVQGTDDKGEKIASTIGDEISKVFKKDGSFGKTMVGLMQSAGIGMVAGSALFGKQSKTQQAGSAVGGAIGGKIGEKVLTKGLESIAKGLGDFAGPLGSIAGGILGNVVGGLFKKAKWGRVDLTSAGASDARGNSGGSEKAALAAGNSILSGLKDLASQLGGTIGDFGSIAVGVRDGKYRVNTGGTSLKVKKGAVDFGDDAEAAVAYAMKQAIERGALAGIRQSTNNLLKAGDDLQSQLQKALSFEGVFSELKGITDPVGAAVDEVNRQFDQLRTIFKEAGATAEEYAQLEQLLTIKRNEALDKERDALEDIRSRIAEAQGDDATVKQIARAKELKDALNDNVRAELQHLYAVEDAMDAQQKLTEVQTEAAAAAQQLKDAWASIGSDLMDEVNRIRGLTGGDGAATFASLQGQFDAATSAARGGDQDAAKRLTELSQSMLEVAANTATSRQELDRIKAQTAASLEATYASINAMVDAPANSPAQQSAAVTGSQVDTAATKASDQLNAQLKALRDEVAALRRENYDGHAATAGAAKRAARVLEDVSGPTGGNAIAVANGT